jgi:hypothetical protein
VLLSAGVHHFDEVPGFELDHTFEHGSDAVPQWIYDDFAAGLESLVALWHPLLLKQQQQQQQKDSSDDNDDNDKEGVCVAFKAIRTVETSTAFPYAQSAPAANGVFARLNSDAIAPIMQRNGIPVLDPTPVTRRESRTRLVENLYHDFNLARLGCGFLHALAEACHLG